MANVYEIDGVVPVIDPASFVHPDAVLVGDVIVGPGCYVGPLASLRGDFGRVLLEEGSNVQDCCVIHSFPGRDAVVGVDGHIGHGAVLHTCTIGRGVLVGINAVVLDGATVGEFAFVAAGSLVKAGFAVPARTLVAGSPAVVVRELTESELAWKANGTRLYQELTRRSLETLRPVEPRAAVEPDRGTVSTGGDAAVPLDEYRTRD
jgi:phenylacetic acid degradation protein